MLIRIKQSDESLEEEIFIPQDRITAIRKTKTDWNDGTIMYEIVVSGYVLRVDKTTYERVVNAFTTLDTETGAFEWNFFGSDE